MIHNLHYNNIAIICTAILPKSRRAIAKHCCTCDERSQIKQITEFLTRANYGMTIGNFELDFTDGEIRYKTSIDVEGDELTPALIKNLVYTNVTMMDEYLPGIRAVIEQTMPPLDAIQMAEGEVLQ